ncbi:MAG: C4-dicarboxylate ABC transporter permease [Sedimentibacter sp.]|uniref:YfcC family protein n=1 Tax=Sedimentibacter sp. TaxID=1960295 RepID=UPI003158ECD8
MVDEKKVKSFKLRLPETATLLVLIILIMAMLTYIVPAGRFQRAVDEATGRTLVVPGTFAYMDQTPVGFMSLLSSVYRGMVGATEIMSFIFVVGGVFGILTKTGAITAALGSLIKKFQGRENILIIIIMTAFAAGGMSYGMGEEVIPFVTILVPIAIKMGYDPIVGVSMVVVALYSGYSAGPLNPFNTGVAQGICQLPLFSGIGIRTVLGIGALAIAIEHTLRYGNKYKKSRLGEIGSHEIQFAEERPVNSTDRLILVILIVTIIVLVFGVLKYEWYFTDIAGLFMLMGIVIGLIYFKGNLEECINEFMVGTKDIAVAAILVSLSRAILVVMEEGNIADTMIYWMSIPLSSMNNIFAAWGMYLSQGFVNFLIPSSSGQAVVVMPIMSSLSDLIGVSRQTAVLAFQSGDGFWNMITPTHPILMASLGLAGVSFSKWFKFSFWLVVKWSIWVIIILTYATLTNLGPF